MQTFFERDWLQYRVGRNSHGVEMLYWSFNDRLTIPSATLGTMVDAVRRMELGSNPFASLSGGVDSQAMCLLLKEAGVKFDVPIMAFENDFNSMDVESAVQFCDKHNITYLMVELEVVKFLTTDLPQFVSRYECPSPQFNMHFRFFEQLMRDFQPSSILCGGNAPFFYEDRLNFVTTRSQNAWTVFAAKNDFPLYGNFLAWSWDLAAPLIVATPNIHNKNALERYLAKVDGMKNLGLDVTPQDQKYTGFERVKEFIGQMMGDGWAFEKNFRHPHFKLFPEHEGVLLDPQIADELLDSNHSYFKART